MKKALLYSLMALAATSASAGNSIPKNGKLAKMTELYLNKKHNAPRLVKLHGFDSPAASIAKATATSPTNTLQAKAFGFLYDEDGNVWYYTQDNAYRSTQYNAYIDKATIKLYNQNHELAGTLNIDVPKDMDVNRIDPYGTVTKKFFDLDNKTQEVLVELHQVGNAENNYQGAFYTRAYHIEDGSIAKEFDGAGVFLNIPKNSWSKYQRLIISNSKYEAVEGQKNEDGTPYYTTNDYIDVYKPAAWGSEPAVEHQFVVDEEYTYYGNDGAPVQVYNVGGTPYYMVSHYEKKWLQGYDEENYDPIPTPDNHLVIKTYDERYNRVDSIAVPIEKSEDTNFPMALIGNFGSKTLSADYFKKDGKLAYVVTFYDYITAHDAFRYKFVAYDHEGNKISDICDGVYDAWFDLNEIKGAEDQMAFMQYTSDEESQQLRIVNLPSCQEATIMPAEIDGNLISTVMNRYGSKDNYKYLMKLNKGIDDGKGNVIARVAWINPDLTVDHYTSFNLGPQAENFGMTLSNSYLDPYLFDTNDKLEFCYQAKQRDESTGAINNVFVIADEDGNTIREFADNENGSVASAGCYAATDTKKEFYVQYSDTEKGIFNLEFYQLPFVKFANGGDGTKENPYLVATAGDLISIKDAPDANYKMVSDINLDNFNITNASWEPISAFSGKFDGDNHSIANLYINHQASSVGLFGDLAAKAHISNLVIANPEIQLTDNNSNVGILAGTAVNDSIQNVHVFGANISGEGMGMIGGIVGQGALETSLSSVSMNNASIMAPQASSVGSIAGDIRTSTVISAAAANNVKIEAQQTVGGIVGAAMMSTVENANVTAANITADNTVGGIMGNNNSSKVDKNIFDGTITVKQANWDGLAAAGIIGSLDPDWSGSTNVIVSNNIAKGKVCLAEGTESDETIHRIVGRTIANEDDCDMKEMRLANNYAVNGMTVNGAEVASDDAATVEGKTATEAELDKAALEAMGYAYGNNSDAPWKEGAKAMPVLYFENTLMALTLSDSHLTLKADDEYELTANAFGASAMDTEVASTDEEVVEIVSTDNDDESVKITLKAKKEGNATINVTLDNITVACEVTVAATTAINTANADNNVMAIVPGNGMVKAEGAVAIAAFSIDGRNVANANGETIATSQLGKGVFVVVATYKDGKKATAKVIVK